MDILILSSFNIYILKALQLPSHIRQEDGSRDSYMNCFNEIDKDGTGNISLMEFLQFMENCREQQTESHKSTFRSFQSLKGVRSIEAGSPMAPANKPIRILDPEDRRAGVTQQPQVKSGPQTLESKRMQSQYVDSQKISLVRSNSDSGNKRNTREFNSLNGPSSAVHRRQIRATDLDESAGRPSPPKMLKQSAVRTSLNQSMESVHSGTLSIKHRRLVGGESVGSEHMPGDTRAEITLQDQSFPPSKPPLNPFVMAHVSHIDDMPPVAQDIRARSEFAEATNTIFEGYLDKKSQMLGLWQKVCA